MTASDEYWEPMVGRVVELTRQVPSASGNGVWQRVARRRGISLGAAVATVAGIVGILAQVGAFDNDPPERGEVRVDRRVASSVERRDHERTDPDVGRRPAGAGYPSASSGYGYNVDLRLDHPQHDRYGLRWTLVDRTQSRPKRGYDNIVWRTYTAEEVDGVHPVWVPCPPDDGVTYVPRFVLTDESVSPSRRLGSDEGGKLDCRPVPPDLTRGTRGPDVGTR